MSSDEITALFAQSPAPWRQVFGPAPIVRMPGSSQQLKVLDANNAEVPLLNILRLAVLLSERKARNLAAEGKPA